MRPGCDRGASEERVYSVEYYGIGMDTTADRGQQSVVECSH